MPPFDDITFAFHYASISSPFSSLRLRHTPDFLLRFSIIDFRH